MKPKEFREIINSIKKIEIALGDGIKRVTNNEKENILNLRKSLVARKGIKKGEKFTVEILLIKDCYWILTNALKGFFCKKSFS